MHFSSITVKPDATLNMNLRNLKLQSSTISNPRVAFEVCEFF